MITTILISFMQFSIVAPHSLHRHCIATQGTLYPKNIQLVMIDDVIVYYYNSSAEQEAVVPEWLNHPEGIEFWQEVHRNLKFNRYVMDTAVRVTSEHYNHSHDHFYQAHGRCGWKSDGTTEAFMSHAYDGKDFVSFDVSTRTWTAAVSHAVFYKRKRETDLEDLVRLVIHYESGCIRWLEKLLEFSVTVREPKGGVVGGRGASHGRRGEQWGGAAQRRRFIPAKEEPDCPTGSPGHPELQLPGAPQQYSWEHHSNLGSKEEPGQCAHGYSHHCICSLDTHCPIQVFSMEESSSTKPKRMSKRMTNDE
ncbi:major histocompatibility complex class I-related gene protein-like isoform X2 [Oncorhynchus clarkii lewisi]|uniref:major histocompatibility complex class I-related gene protein-like isoform X2 n=1 Tax=Oncorhynchus clarkii lewisi TaxID=490388 RepID=UPI0039B9203D